MSSSTHHTDPEVLRLRRVIDTAREEDPLQVGVIVTGIASYLPHVKTQVREELVSAGYTVDNLFGLGNWLIAPSRRRPAYRPLRSVSALRASVDDARRRDGRQMRGTFVVFLAGHPDREARDIVRAELEEQGYTVEEALGQWSITPRRTPYMAPALAAPTLERHYADGREYLPPSRTYARRGR